MNRLLSRIASVFAAGAIVVIVALMFFQAEGGNEPPDSTDDYDSYVSPTDYFTPEQPDDVTPSTEPEVSPSSTPPPPTGTTTRQVIDMSGIGIQLAFTLPDTFEHTQNDMRDFYIYKPANDPLVSIEIVVNEGSAEAVAPAFLFSSLPNHTHSTDPQTVKLGSISDTIYVSVYNDEQIIEAWLIEAGDYYVAIIAGYHTQEQRDYFASVLHTMELIEL